MRDETIKKQKYFLANIDNAWIHVIHFFCQYGIQLLDFFIIFILFHVLLACDMMIDLNIFYLMMMIIKNAFMQK